MFTTLLFKIKNNRLTTTAIDVDFPQTLHEPCIGGSQVGPEASLHAHTAVWSDGTRFAVAGANCS